jgi:hypothetical protein
LTIHLIPMESMTDPRRFKIPYIDTSLTSFPPLGASGWNYRFNVDGFLTFSTDHHDKRLSRAYTQLFRSGCIEAVNAHLLDERDGNRFLASEWFEPVILRTVATCLKGLESLGVELPILFLLAIVGAKGAWMATRSHDHGWPIVKELTLTSLGRLIKQLGEEIMWYESHALVREPRDPAATSIPGTGGTSTPCTN